MRPLKQVELGFLKFGFLYIALLTTSSLRMRAHIGNPLIWVMSLSENISITFSLMCIDPYTLTCLLKGVLWPLSRSFCIVSQPIQSISLHNQMIPYNLLYGKVKISRPPLYLRLLHLIHCIFWNLKILSVELEIYQCLDIRSNPQYLHW